MKVTKFNKIRMGTHVIIKKILLPACLGLAIALSGHSLAQNINSVSQEVLQNVKGVGPSKAKKIITERLRGGDFQGAEDLSQRVKGVGKMTILKMTQAGIQITQETSSSPTSRPSDIAEIPLEKKRRSRSRTP